MSKTESYNAESDGSDIQKQVLSVEDAECKILEICKKTVLDEYSKESFVKQVNDVIRELSQSIKNKQLAERLAEALRKYSLRTLERETRLLRLQASFYSAVNAALIYKSNVPDAVKYSRVIAREYSSELIGSKGFSRLSTLMTHSYAAYNEAVPLNTLYKEYTEMVNLTLNELIAVDAKEDYVTNVNLRNIAEMTIRYDEQLDMIEGLRNEGVRLAYIEGHVNCSKRCAKYQVGGTLHPSGLYSLDGTYGETPDGIKYVPLEFATNNPIDLYTTRAGKTYQNGCITGFNCRHKLTPYKPNNPPVIIPEKAIRERRAIELRQREMEREIRYQKRLAIQTKGVYPIKSARAKAEAIKLNNEYIAFCQKHKVAFYPERTKVLSGEERFPLRRVDR